jgi:uncharacterized protein (DUF302 family)
MDYIQRFIRLRNGIANAAPTRSARMTAMMRVACVLIAAIVAYSTPAVADNHLVIKKSGNSVSDTVDRLSDVLKARGISIVARVDHAAAAMKSGLSLKPTVLLIFGNPKLGTPLMQSNSRVGLDLPMKVLIWQDDSGQVWLGYAKPGRLKADYGLKDQDATLQQMADALHKLTEEAIRAK